MIQTRGNLFCIHGFLGQAVDWEGLELGPFVAWSLFSPPQSGLEQPPLTRGLETMGAWINDQARLRAVPGAVNILLGYSLGGRIALHALEQAPDLWAGAILVSTHPGLLTAEQKSTRQFADAAWADRFKQQDWSSLLRDWGAQGVFRNTNALERRESDYSRQALSEGLRFCSLGEQKDFRPVLQRVTCPILWVVGAEDEKFFSLSQEVSQLSPQLKLCVIPSAGHRVPWDQPQLFAQAVGRFRSSCSSGVVFPLPD